MLCKLNKLTTMPQDERSAHETGYSKGDMKLSTERKVSKRMLFQGGDPHTRLLGATPSMSSNCSHNFPFLSLVYEKWFWEFMEAY
jgi:hypothetical protein